ncbi:hypothetical protein HDU99_010930, partial [Rhizoclosmatium hyalinum]
MQLETATGPAASADGHFVESQLRAGKVAMFTSAMGQLRDLVDAEMDAAGTLEQRSSPDDAQRLERHDANYRFDSREQQQMQPLLRPKQPSTSSEAAALPASAPPMPPQPLPPISIPPIASQRIYSGSAAPGSQQSAFPTTPLANAFAPLTLQSPGPNGPPKTPTTPLPSVTDLLRGTRSDYS